jgi:hypothetical protein
MEPLLLFMHELVGRVNKLCDVPDHRNDAAVVERHGNSCGGAGEADTLCARSDFSGSVYPGRVASAWSHQETKVLALASDRSGREFGKVGAAPFFEDLGSRREVIGAERDDSSLVGVQREIRDFLSLHEDPMYLGEAGSREDNSSDIVRARADGAAVHVERSLHESQEGVKDSDEQCTAERAPLQHAWLCVELVVPLSSPECHRWDAVVHAEDGFL